MNTLNNCETLKLTRDYEFEKKIIEMCLKSNLIRNVFSSFDFEQLISINVVTQLVMFGTGDANVNLNTVMNLIWHK